MKTETPRELLEANFVLNNFNNYYKNSSHDFKNPMTSEESLDNSKLEEIQEFIIDIEEELQEMKFNFIQTTGADWDREELKETLNSNIQKRMKINEYLGVSENKLNVNPEKLLSKIGLNIKDFGGEIEIYTIQTKDFVEFCEKIDNIKNNKDENLEIKMTTEEILAENKKFNGFVPQSGYN